MISPTRGDKSEGDYLDYSRSFQKAITQLILQNSSDLKGIVSETYEELDRLNSSIQQFFREGRSDSGVAANEASKNLAVLTGQFTKLKE